MPHAITGEKAKGLCASCENSCEPKLWLAGPCTVPAQSRLDENLKVIECSRYETKLRRENDGA